VTAFLSSHRFSNIVMDLHFSQVFFLFFAAGIAGILNALAGGGSFISFPALLFLRVPPVEANATNTVALWPGLAASTLAYLKRLNVPLRLLIPLLATSVAGGWAGALLLLKLSHRKMPNPNALARLALHLISTRDYAPFMKKYRLIRMPTLITNPRTFRGSAFCA